MDTGKDNYKVQLTVTATFDYFYAELIATVIAAVQHVSDFEDMGTPLDENLIDEIQALIEMVIDHGGGQRTLPYLRRMLESKLEHVVSGSVDLTQQ